MTEASQPAPISVSNLTSMIRASLTAQPALEDVLVEGEISNLSRPASGHLYLTLKDRNAALSCVCFRTNALQIGFRPENGMQVILRGSIDVYDQAGRYQLYVQTMEPSGLGALALAVEQTKRTLAAEGLFDPRHKRPLPRLPRRIAVVTSATGAAIRDVTTVIRRRAPGTDIVVCAAIVQGPEAVGSIIAALSAAAGVRAVDLILLVRGGGSLEDLMAFNSEHVARHIRRMPVPVVAGVGHETDTTIADLAADHRAPTPSAAAELAVPVEAELRAGIGERGLRLRSSLGSFLQGRRDALRQSVRLLALSSPQARLGEERRGVEDRRARLLRALRSDVALARSHYENTTRLLAGLSPRARIIERRALVEERIPRLRDALGRTLVARRQLLDDRAARLAAVSRRGVVEGRRRLEASSARLQAFSPLGVLERGYSMTLGPDGTPLTDAASVSAGDALTTRLWRGVIQSQVTGAEGAEERTDVR